MSVLQCELYGTGGRGRGNHIPGNIFVLVAGPGYWRRGHRVFVDAR